MQRGKGISKYAVIAVACVISMLALEATGVFAKNSGNFGGDYKILKASPTGENIALKVSFIRSYFSFLSPRGFTFESFRAL